MSDRSKREPPWKPSLLNCCWLLSPDGSGSGAVLCEPCAYPSTQSSTPEIAQVQKEPNQHRNADFSFSHKGRCYFTLERLAVGFSSLPSKEGTKRNHGSYLESFSGIRLLVGKCLH